MEKIILSSDEDITEITEFNDKEKVSVQRVDALLQQNDWINREYREFTIFNGHQCYQKVKSRSQGKKKFRANLDFLDPIPVIQTRIAYHFIAPAIVLMAISLIIIFNYGWGHSSWQTIFRAVAEAGLVSSILLLMYGLNQSRRRVIFHSRYGRAPVLEMFNNSPSRKAFRHFTEDLKTRIRHRHNQTDSVNLDSLKAELHEIRRLKHEGALAPGECNNAIRRIMKHAQYSLK